VRDDLVQKRRDGNHRALGLEPEAAQGLEVFDRPRGTPSDAAALFHTILELSPPEQRLRETEEIDQVTCSSTGIDHLNK